MYCGKNYIITQIEQYLPFNHVFNSVFIMYFQICIYYFDQVSVCCPANDSTNIAWGSMIKKSTDVDTDSEERIQVLQVTMVVTGLVKRQRA